MNSKITFYKRNIQFLKNKLFKAKVYYLNRLGSKKDINKMKLSQIPTNENY